MHQILASVQNHFRYHFNQITHFFFFAKILNKFRPREKDFKPVIQSTKTRRWCHDNQHTDTHQNDAQHNQYTT
jgi:hypothetical protein